MAKALYSIQELYLYPTYASRAEYREKTGKEAPAFDPSRPPKNWLDPQAAASPRRLVVYDSVLVLKADGLPMAGPDGKPLTDFLVLKKEDAASVNIWEGGMGVDIPVDAPTPVPMRALNQNEQLIFNGPMNAVMVRDKSVPLAELGDGFTTKDRELLYAIAAAIGVKTKPLTRVA